MTVPRLIRGGLLLTGLLAVAALVLSGLPRRGGRAGAIVLATYQLTDEALPLERMGIAEGLTRAGYVFEPVEPALAGSFADEGRGEWRFTLREGLVFHDGTPLDAAAAVAGLERFLASSAGAPVRGLFTVRARDARTVVALAASPSVPVPAYLARIPILAPASFGPRGEMVRPVGTGPFAAAEFEFDRGARLVANRRWWGGEPGLDAIEVRVVKDPGTRVLLLETGEADWIQMVPRHEVARLRDAGFMVVRSSYLYNVYLQFNVRSGPGADAALRRAAAASIDRARIAAVAFEGTAEPAFTIFPEDRPFVPAGLPNRARDPDAARRILAARPAGVPDRITILVVSEGYRPSWSAAAEIIRQDLEAVGIRAEIRVLEKGAWNARIADRTFEATIRGRVPALWPDPLACLGFDFRTDGPTNITGFSDPDFDRALDEGLRAPDAGVRNARLAEAQRILANEVPVIPLVHDFGRETYAVRPGIEGASDESSRRTGFPGPRVRARETSRE